MQTKHQRLRHALITAWTVAVIVFLYMPTVCITLASLTASRYFQFPIAKWGLAWWDKTFNSIEIRQLLSTSITIALCVTVIAVVLAFFGALAFARYDWKGRRSTRSSSCCRSSSRSRCWASRCSCGSTRWACRCPGRRRSSRISSGSCRSSRSSSRSRSTASTRRWRRRPIDLGASRWQVLREVTLPVLFPGLFSGALFAFLLSWGNFPLSLFTTGADTTVPEYLYAKMVAGYTPGVPVLGTVSTVGAAILLIGGYARSSSPCGARSRRNRNTNKLGGTT